MTQWFLVVRSFSGLEGDGDEPVYGEGEAFYETDSRAVAEELVKLFQHDHKQDPHPPNYEVVDGASLSLAERVLNRGTLDVLYQMLDCGGDRGVMADGGLPSDAHTVLLSNLYAQAHQWEPLVRDELGQDSEDKPDQVTSSEGPMDARPPLDSQAAKQQRTGASKGTGMAEDIERGGQVVQVKAASAAGPSEPLSPYRRHIAAARRLLQSLPSLTVEDATGDELAYAENATLQFLKARFGDEDEPAKWPRDWSECPEAWEVYMRKISEYRAMQAASHLEAAERASEKAQREAADRHAWRFEGRPDGAVLASNRKLCQEYAKMNMDDLLLISHKWRQMVGKFVQAADQAGHHHGYRGAIVHDEQVQRVTKLLETALASRKIKGIDTLGRCLRHPSDGHLHWALAALDELDAHVRAEAAGSDVAAVGPSPASSRRLTPSGTKSDAGQLEIGKVAAMFADDEETRQEEKARSEHQRQVAAAVERADLLTVLEALKADLATWADGWQNAIARYALECIRGSNPIVAIPVGRMAMGFFWIFRTLFPLAGQNEAFEMLEFQKGTDYAQAFKRRFDDLCAWTDKLVTKMSSYRGPYNGASFHLFTVELDEDRKDLQVMAGALWDYLHSLSCQLRRQQHGASGAPSQATDRQSAPPAPPRKPTPAVVLGNENESPKVCGVTKRPLAPKDYIFVKALVESFPSRLGIGDLERQTNRSEPAKTFKKLRKDPDWARAILMPGRPHGGYGIADMNDVAAQQPE